MKLPSDGYYEVWARATDANGVMQPHQAGLWNPQGYGGNAMHRIAVLVGRCLVRTMPVPHGRCVPLPLVGRG